MEIYKDSTRPVDERVEDLLSRMTLEEKVAQLCGDLPTDLIQDGMPSEELLKEKYPNGHGRFTQYSTSGVVDPEKAANLANTLQKYFVEDTRLGIPVALQTENLCGLPVAGATIFPAQINASCTWDPDLVEEMSSIISQESKAIGANSAMSPVIDIVRDHRWGRVYETYGEDPYLTSQMGIHYVKGMQKDKTDGVASVAKHFLGYSESQGGLNTADCRIPDRELYEVFATPFEAAMREADVSSVMANYGEIDGMCVVANKKIATGLLRDTMKFDGILTSDGAGIMKTFTDFHIADSYKEAGYLAKKAGTDTEIPVGGSFKQLPDYVRSGELDESCIDDSVRRVLKVKFEYGLFEDPYVDVDKVKGSLTNSDKKAVSKKMAAESLVLLKNDGILPLKKGTKIALVGPHADSVRYPISGYTFPAYLEMLTAAMGGQDVSIGGMADEENAAKKKAGGSSGGATGGGPFAAFAHALTPAERDSIKDVTAILKDMGIRSLKDVLGERFEVNYAEGVTITGTDDSGIPDAVKAAEESDVVIMACGGNCGWNDATGGEGIDRCELGLPGIQQDLLEAVAATGKPVILITYGPGLFALPWACDHTAAMIQAWMPGPFAGEVMADALDGTTNFGGKLTTTILRSVGQTPVTYNHRTGSGYSSIPDSLGSLSFTGGYVDEDNAPLFCFGHGLSYTTFELSDFSIGSKTVPTDGVIKVSVDVTNTGDRAGDEVVQLYFHTKKAHVVRPVKQLAGFKRISLQPGETKHVSFELKTAQMAYYNEDLEFVVEPSQIDIMVGTSAHDIAFADVIELTGEKNDVMGRRSYTCDVRVE